MTRAVLDGPLTFDSAISREAQTTKQFAVPVASDADTHPISKPAIRSPRRST
jgi:phosphotransacetylase